MYKEFCELITWIIYMASFNPFISFHEGLNDRRQQQHKCRKLQYVLK